MMQVISREISGLFPSGKAELTNYLLGCIDAEICPLCGNDLICCEPAFALHKEQPVLFTCLHCDWHDYA